MMPAGPVSSYSHWCDGRDSVTTTVFASVAVMVSTGAHALRI